MNLEGFSPLKLFWKFWKGLVFFGFLIEFTSETIRSLTLVEDIFMTDSMSLLLIGLIDFVFLPSSVLVGCMIPRNYPFLLDYWVCFCFLVVSVIISPLSFLIQIFIFFFACCYHFQSFFEKLVVSLIDFFLLHFWSWFHLLISLFMLTLGLICFCFFF